MNRYADIDTLIRSVDDAFQRTLRATLAVDRTAAAEVLAGSDERRAVAYAAECALRQRPWVPAPQVEQELRLVTDLAMIGLLVDRLAGMVTTQSDRGPLGPSGQLEVSVLLDAGHRRLRELLGVDHHHPHTRGCAAALFEVADHAAAADSIVLRLCGDMAIALLETSRHAAVA